MALKPRFLWKKVLRNALVFLIGCGLSLGIAVAVVGFNVLFLPLLPLGGLVFFALALVAKSLLNRFLRHTVTHRIEQAIEAIGSSDDISLEFDRLAQSLALANDGLLNSDCLSFPYQGQTLLNYARSQSEHHLRVYFPFAHLRHDRHLAQDWIKLIQLLSKGDTRPPLTWTQRLILRLQGVLGVSYGLHQEQSAVIDQLTQDFTQLEKAEISKEQVDPLFFAPPAVVIDQDLDSHEPTLPAHLRHWAKQFVLVQQHQQNQQYQQQMVQDQNEAVDLSLAGNQQAQSLVDISALQQVNWHCDFLDHGNSSHWFRFLVEAVIKESDRLGLLDVRIKDLSFEQQGFLVVISEQAREALNKSANLRFNTNDEFDLDSLSGFWVELRQDQAGFVLKYDPQHLEKTKHLAQRDLYIKPAALAWVRNGHSYSGINVNYVSLLSPTKEQFKQQAVYEYPVDKSFWFERLAQLLLADWQSLNPEELYNPTMDEWKQRLQLNEQQVEFIKRNANQLPMHRLVDIFQQSSAEDTRLFIECLRQLSQRNALTQPFVRPYWVSCPFCNWTLHLKSLQHVVQFNEEELAWFTALSDYGADLDEVVNGLVYFFNFFKSKNLPLPTVPSSLVDLHTTISNRGSYKFVQLKGILDCIALATNQKRQAQWLDQLPMSLATSKRQLRAGYIAVHRAMCFDSSETHDPQAFRIRFPNLVDPMHISADELAGIDYQDFAIPPTPLEGWASQNYQAMSEEQRNYHMYHLRNPIYYRALFLRYCAAQLDATHFEKALARWEELMGEQLSSLPEISSKPSRYWYAFDGRNESPVNDLEQKLKTHWATIKAEILAFPTKISAPNLQANWLVTNKNEKLYAQDDLNKLLHKMGVNEDDAAALRQDIEYLNSKTATFPASHAELQEAINKATQAYRDLADKPEELHQAMLECLALMREAHYRTTAKGSQKGQWLRLEQLVVILLDLQHSGLWQIKTDEGKTLIIQFIAMLHRLQGKDVTVITHNERLAAASCDQFKSLARIFGLKLAHRTHANQAEGDIIFSDISTAVIQQQRKRFEQQEEQAERTKVVLIDEIDNVAIDIQADTTMQISTDGGTQADDEFRQFLQQLNYCVRVLFQRHQELRDKDSQREYLITVLKNDPYYLAHCQTTKALDRWISAAVSAMQLKEKIHYVIEQGQIRIVHKDTTGRVDRISKWGKGVHQCVAAWECHLKKAPIHIPALSQIIAEGTVWDYLKNEFTVRSGFTGTFGEAALQKEVEQVLFDADEKPRSFFVPPARRSLPKDVKWPLTATSQYDEEGEELEPVIEEANKRFYKFKPQIFAQRNQQLHALLKAVQNTQAKELSAIIFLNTIEECDQLAEFLSANGVAAAQLQILDDTEDEQMAQNGLRPGEATVIDQAKKAGMITLSTATGGRGTDFADIEVGINARPSMQRVEEQAEGRLARHSGFAMFYELYCAEDMLGDVAELTDDLRLAQWQRTKQAQQIDRLNARKGFDQFKQEQQQAFFAHRRSLNEDQKALLDKAWSSYFTNLCWQAEEDRDDLPAFQFGGN